MFLLKKKKSYLLFLLISATISCLYAGSLGGAASRSGCVISGDEEEEEDEETSLSAPDNLSLTAAELSVSVSTANKKMYFHLNKLFSMQHFLALCYYSDPCFSVEEQCTLAIQLYNL